MKRNQKMTALLLGLLLLTSACANSGNNAEESAAPTAAPSADVEAAAAEEEDTYVYDDLETKDFNGWDYRILSTNFYDKELATYITFDEMTGDPVNDTLYDSKCYIEDRFNVAISWIETGTFGAGTDKAKSSISAGDNSFEIMIEQDHNVFDMVKAGYMYNLMDVDQFNFDKPWWPENAVESLRIGNQLYAASSYLSYCGLHWTRVITINKDYADDLMIPIPYDTVREGRWTLEELFRLTEDNSMDMDGNGKINSKDKVAFTSGIQTWYCMQEACGIPVYAKDQDHIPYLNFDVERVVKYADLMKKLITGPDFVSSGDFGIEVFQNGNALFAYTQVGDAYDYYRISDVRYGFLPSPKLDELQEDYINCCTDVPWALPKTLYGDQLELSGTITEAMSCYNYNHVLPAYYESAIKARIADSPDDTEMLQLIADTRSMSFSYTYALTFNNICTDCVEGNKEVASYYEKSQKAASKALEKLVQSFEKME